MYKILLAEDDLGLREITKLALKGNGYEVDTADDGVRAVELIDANMDAASQYDAIVLDIMMPKKDGREVCKYIRQKYDVPVIFLTALGEEQDIITGYEIGADEYITKPYTTAILLAKLAVLIKRYHGTLIQNGQMKADEITIIPARRFVTVNGKEITLAPKEYDLLMYFLDHKNQVLSRYQILNAVWGFDYEGYDRAVDTHVKKLRQVLGPASYHLETVIKAGYMWK